MEKSRDFSCNFINRKREIAKVQALAWIYIEKTLLKQRFANLAAAKTGLLKAEKTLTK